MNTQTRLHGFNNLTKTLSFNIYDICYAYTPEQVSQYIEHIDERYNAGRLTQILTDVAKIIGAVDLRAHLAAESPELPHTLLRVGHRDHGLPSAGVHAGRRRQEHPAGDDA